LALFFGHHWAATSGITSNLTPNLGYVSHLNLALTKLTFSLLLLPHNIPSASSTNLKAGLMLEISPLLH
jgi:hypothetical protein